MHQYPGLGLPLRQYDDRGGRDVISQLYPSGVYDESVRSNSEMLLVREVAMMIVMNNLTDKPNWEDKVFDNAITEKWIEEALAIPVQPLYDSITRGKMEIEPEKQGWFYPRRLATVLDRSCLEYARMIPIVNSAELLTCQSSVLRSFDPRPSSSRGPD
jgi:hypothetical protein